MKIENGALAHNYAISIEHRLRSVFNCQRGGFGGQIDADVIQKHPYLSMTQGIAYLYGRNGDIEKMDEFIDKYVGYSDFSIEDFLGFEDKKREIGGIEFQLINDNGEKELKCMIEEFEKVIK